MNFQEIDSIGRINFLNNKQILSYVIVTSVTKISIPSTVVYYYCTWYTYIRNRCYWKSDAFRRKWFLLYFFSSSLNKNLQACGKNMDKDVVQIGIWGLEHKFLQPFLSDICLDHYWQKRLFTEYWGPLKRPAFTIFMSLLKTQWASYH